MTAQIHDQVWLDGGPDPWVLTAVEGVGGFEPAAVGVRARPFSTACWRGWYAGYRLQGDRLVLELLGAGLDEADVDALRAGGGPRVDGLAPAKRRFRGKRYLGPDQWEEGEFEGPEWTWNGLAHPVPFTGGWLVSRGFLRSLSVHMGFHPAWKYEHTIELLFREGRLVERRDVSASMAALRAELAGRDAPTTTDRGRIEAWIEGTFSRRYPGLH